jgi:hypothetical protein
MTTLIKAKKNPDINRDLSKKTADGILVRLWRKGDDDEDSDWLGPRRFQVQRANQKMAD